MTRDWLLGVGARRWLAGRRSSVSGPSIVLEQSNTNTVQFWVLVGGGPYIRGVTNRNDGYVGVEDLFWICFFEFPLGGTKREGKLGSPV